MTGAADVETRLADLEAKSQERTAELRAIAAELPAVVGRRAMIRTLVGDLRANPNKRELARRASLKVGRIPTRLAREIRRGINASLDRTP